MTDTTWNASADGNWNDAGNWSNGIPTGTDKAIFDATSVKNCTVDVAEVLAISSSAAYTGSVTLGQAFRINSTDRNGESPANALVWGASGNASAGGKFDCAGYSLTCSGGVYTGFDGKETFIDFGTANCSIWGMRGEQGKALVSGTSGILHASGGAMPGGYYFAFPPPGTEAYGFHHKNGTVLLSNDDTSGGFAIIRCFDLYNSSVSAKMGFYNLILSGTNTEYGGATPKTYYGGGRFTGVSVRNNLTVKDGSFWAVYNTYAAATCNVSGNMIINGDWVGSTVDHHCRLYAADDSVTIDVVGTMSLTSGSIDWSGHAQGLDKSPGNITVGSTINLNMDSALHVSGGTHSANNWDKSSGPGTLHCWGDETVSSNDNMQLKGVYHEDCTATINCPAVMGNGGVQAVSGTATPTFIVGGWSASLRPPGNSTVILTGTRDVYVDSGGGSYEESGFWNLILSGGASTNKKMGGGQNTSFKVFNDFEIQADCVFATDGTTSITAPQPALEVSGAMNIYGTFSGNRNTYAPDQRFENVEIEATGVFDATSGTTFLGNSPLIQLSTADSTFTHNNGTVLLSDTAHGGWNLGGDGNFNGTNSFYNLSISGSVVNVSSNYLNVENDFTCIHNTANPASYGYQWRPYNGSTTIQGDLILKESGSGYPCSFGNYYIAGAGYTANTTIYGNVIMGSGTILALTTSGSKTFELYGNFINNGGEVRVF